MKRRPAKHLSQNFLTDSNIARKIIQALSITPDSLVVEIGAGNGVLTKILVEIAQQVVAVELDPLLANELTTRLSNPSNLQILQQDFLKTDLEEIFSTALTKNIFLIGNIPYHITSPIIFKILESPLLFKTVVLMVQKEVGKRLAASPGTKSYGILSVLCQTKAKVEYLFTVPAHLFFPPPKVFSGVIRLTFSTSAGEDVPEWEFFKTIVRTTFGLRRKMLRNTLSGKFSKTILNKLDFDLSRRPESLSVGEFKSLANQILKIKQQEP